MFPAVFGRNPDQGMTMPQTTWKKFRKLPVVIEARPCEPGGEVIETLEGTMTASPGDWIIRGVNGETYPCKPDIFAKTYEETQ